jgi:surfeit locus 1 family protein
VTRYKAFGILAGIVVLAVAAVCVRLGFWQLERLREKQGLIAADRAAGLQPPIEWHGGDADIDRLIGQRVLLRGTYDETRQILLRGRMHQGEPGVMVVTPLLTESGERVLIQRGWLPAEDALTARPQDYSEPGHVEVVGFAQRLESQGRAPSALRGTDPRLYTAARLNRDSLAAVFPYPLASFVVHQHNAPGVSVLPVRTVEVPDAAMHLGYAVQWFAFAVILVTGSTYFAWTRRRRGSTRNLPPQG